MGKKLHPRLTAGVRSSIKNPQKIGGSGGGGTIHPILIAPQIQRPKHLNLTVSQTQIYRHHLIVVYQVMLNAKRERDPRETAIDTEKGEIEDETKDANGVIRDRSINQKGCIEA